MAEEAPPTLESLNAAVGNLKAELDAFYLMWAGARVPAALAPPLSRHRRGHMGWCCRTLLPRAAQVR